MAADNLIKDLGELHARLLDHRPVLQGEISFFLKEFEEKRGNREEYRLQKSLEYTRECAERLVPEILNGLETHFVEFVKKVSTATAMCNLIAEKEENQQKVEPLKSKRVARVIEWNHFMEKQCELSNQVDKEFEAELQTLKEQYRELEEKLNMSSVSS